MAQKQITKTFEHIQSTGANIWTITHNLGTEYPVVDIWIDAGQPGVDPTDDELLVPVDVSVTKGADTLDLVNSALDSILSNSLVKIYNYAGPR